MKKIKVSEITNEAIRKVAEEKKVSYGFIVAVDNMNPESKLYYFPWGQEVIDEAGTVVWPDAPEFAALKTRITTKPMTVMDVIKALRAVENKKAVVKIKVGETQSALSNIVSGEGTLVLS
jgi:hypothetical protein